MKKVICVISALVVALIFASGVYAADRVLFDFETDPQGWEIPDWALEKEDHVADSIYTSENFVLEGKSALEVKADFPGGRWTSAYVEVVEYFDWTPYSEIAADVYLPLDAPVGLKAKLILTVGESWQWVEMARSTALEPGEWVTISGNLKPDSTDWRTKVTDSFRQDIRKLGARVESNMKPAYTGSIYIDNIRLVE